MPEITNPELLRVVNQRVRPSGDQWSKSYWEAKRTIKEWDVNKTGEQIADSPDTTMNVGDKVLTGQEVHDIIRTSRRIIKYFENPDPENGDRIPGDSITKVASKGAFS